jgi:hypothetical protein
MKLAFSLLYLFSLTMVFCQGIKKSDALRGPQNTLNNGVIDGVVVKDEVPVRSAVVYEHVRLADYVWSKRLFSRIDAREKTNHPLFYPFDKFMIDFTDFPPSNRIELANHTGWIKNQERLSLWTIIQQHLMLGDLTMYYVSDTNDIVYKMEDGYSFKYLLKKSIINQKDSYFNNYYYRNQINSRIGISKSSSTWQCPLYQGLPNVSYTASPQDINFQSWFTAFDAADVAPMGVSQQSYTCLIQLEDRGKLEKAWDKAFKEAVKTNQTVELERPGVTYFLSSDLITAYNIKEDWFFDKERSMLDKRIISIAPVAKFTLDTTKVSGRGALIVSEPVKSKLVAADLLGTSVSIQSTTEKELFWLYFPELRNVMVNYYVYNNQSDAQWMTFDDFFWKRMFSATIYRATDQFDREIEDYRYGVDALYEAEKIKENMRTWETDLWNY